MAMPRVKYDPKKHKDLPGLEGSVDPQRREEQLKHQLEMNKQQEEFKNKKKDK